MDKILKLVAEHPFSSTFALINPLVIPPVYHNVIAQVLLTLGAQMTFFLVEFLRKKAKLKARKADVEQSFDEFLDGKDPTQFR